MKIIHITENKEYVIHYESIDFIKWSSTGEFIAAWSPPD